MDRKVVLIYPQFASPLNNVKGFNMPLSLLHLGTYIESKGYKPKIIDTVIEEQYQEMIRGELDDALCVGVSVMTAQLPHAMEIIRDVKAHRKDIPVVIGGAHATLFGAQSVESSLIDYAIVGEGEEPMVELCDALSSGNQEGLEGIEGLAFRKDSGDVIEDKTIRRFDYMEMPPINYDLLNPMVIQKYCEIDSLYFPLLTARGCPHKCAFCINVIHKEYRQYVPWSSERTILEVKRILSLPKKGKHNITFFDENTFVNKKRIEGILDAIEEGSLDFHWYCSARANYFRDGFLDVPFLKRLHDCGMRRISLGIETGSGKVLSYLEKGITVEDIIRAAEYCEEANIRPSYSMMIGLPDEDAQDIQKTIDLIALLAEKHKSWGIVGPQLFRPYPGSKIYQDCVDAGLHEPQSIEEWIENVKENNAILDAQKMPWIKRPDMVNYVHFYTVIAAARYSKLFELFNEYCNMTKRNIGFRVLGLAGILGLSFIGKVRRHFDYYGFLIEKVIFEKMRRAHISF